MRIFYQGYSPNADSIADRRRLGYWAKSREVQLLPLGKIENLKAEDIIVVTSSGDFARISRLKKRYPNVRIVFDAVDGIHGEVSQSHDLLRGLAYCFSGRVSSIPRSMKVLLKKYLTNFDHLICSSREQKILWGDFYNGEVSEILDFHSEVPFVEFSPRNSDGLGFMWEGLPYTLNHIIELQDLLNTYPRSRLCILTRFDSKMILNRFFDINVAKLVQAKLPQNTRSIEVLPWSIENLSVVSHKSNFGVIPIQTGISYDHLKAENRLLIMWRLGLPTITGPLPSYKRLQESIGIQFVCENKHDWSRIIKNFLDNPELTGEYMKRAQEYIKSTHSDEILLRKWDLALVPKSRSDSFSLLAP